MTAFWLKAVNGNESLWEWWEWTKGVSCAITKNMEHAFKNPKNQMWMCVLSAASISNGCSSPSVVGWNNSNTSRQSDPESAGRSHMTHFTNSVSFTPVFISTSVPHSSAPVDLHSLQAASFTSQWEFHLLCYSHTHTHTHLHVWCGSLLMHFSTSSSIHQWC